MEREAETIGGRPEPSVGSPSRLVSAREPGRSAAEAMELNDELPVVATPAVAAVMAPAWVR